MDEKFRLVFACPEQTPSADAYLASDALAFDRLRDAVEFAGTLNMVWGVPFIAHKFTVLQPSVVELLFRELVIPRSS